MSYEQLSPATSPPTCEQPSGVYTGSAIPRASAQRVSFSSILHSLGCLKGTLFFSKYLQRTRTVPILYQVQNLCPWSLHSWGGESLKHNSLKAWIYNSTVRWVPCLHGASGVITRRTHFSLGVPDRPLCSPGIEAEVKEGGRESHPKRGSSSRHGRSLC